MPADQLDLDKLAKILQLTDSSHEGEALNSIRLANQMLKKAGVNYGELLKPKEETTSIAKLRSEFLKRMRFYTQKHQREVDELKEAHRQEIDYLNRRIVWWREKSAAISQATHKEELVKLNRKVDWWRHKYQYLLEKADQEKAELAVAMTKRINYWKGKANGTLLGLRTNNPAA